MRTHTREARARARIIYKYTQSSILLSDPNIRRRHKNIASRYGAKRLTFRMVYKTKKHN